MGCFSSKEDDHFKENMKTTKLISEAEEEDRKARRDIEEMVFARALELSLKEDQQLPNSHRETFKDEGQRKHSKDDVEEAVNLPPPNPDSISDHGKSVIEGGKSVDPQALCCEICQKPFAVDEIRKRRKYHIHCYEHRFDCSVCKEEIPLNGKGERECKKHPFWKKNYCPVHDNDETPKCCSCEQLEPKGEGEATYVMLDDFRWLCLPCMESSVMDSCESVPLLDEIKGFFESKALIIEKKFPLLMVEIQALNRAETYEKIEHRHAALTRGLCMSEKQNVKSIITRPTGRGPRNRLTGMVTMDQEVSGCEVTGILIIYGLPRLLTGYILAHEMMHAWLRLNGYKNLKLELEEGLCQVLALMWLESHTFAFTEAEAASSSSSRTPLAATTSKKGDAWSDYEKRLQEFCIYQIKEDESPVYGQGFKKVYKMMRSNNYSVKDTLKEIVTISKS